MSGTYVVQTINRDFVIFLREANIFGVTLHPRKFLESAPSVPTMSRGLFIFFLGVARSDNSYFLRYWVHFATKTVIKYVQVHRRRSAMRNLVFETLMGPRLTDSAKIAARLRATRRGDSHRRKDVSVAFVSGNLYPAHNSLA